MDISSIRLKQTLSARVASTGLQSSIPIGGSSTVSLNSVNADIIYGFSIESKDAANIVKWRLDTHTLEQTEGSTAPTSTETIGPTGVPASIVDVNGAAIPTAQCAVAIYYEIPADTPTNHTVRALDIAADETSKFGTIKLVGNVDAEEQSGGRSALFTPRQSCTADSITFTFSHADVKINVIYLANTTFV